MFGMVLKFAVALVILAAMPVAEAQQGQALQKVRKELQSLWADSVSVQVYSSESRQGVDELRGIVGDWLGLGGTAPAA